MNAQWTVMESYFQKYTLSSLQIDSFNTLVTTTIPEIIANKNMAFSVNDTQTFIVSFNNVYIDKPHVYDEHRNKIPLYPHEARCRDVSYETHVSCDIVTTLIHTESRQVVRTHQYTKVHLFTLPVMLRSCICYLNDTFELQHEDPLDFGGYFIVKGKERVIIAQERINYNQVYVYPAPKNTKYTYIAEVRSIKENADYSVLLQTKRTLGGKLVVALPYVTQDIPLGILFLAMGCAREDIPVFLEGVDTEYLRTSVDPYTTMGKDDCLRYIAEYVATRVDELRKLQHTEQMLANEILPHLGLYATVQQKCLYMGSMVRKLIRTAEGTRPEDDRDHICNKRVEMVGTLLGTLIKSLFKRCLRTMQQTIEKKQQDTKPEDYNVVNLIHRFNITQRIYYCFTTGNWGLPKSNYIRQGVSQILNRLSYLGTVSHLRRVIVPIGKESRNTQVRQLHATSYGFLCPVETPEGASCGIIKSFALFVRVSEVVDTTQVRDVLHSLFPAMGPPRPGTGCTCYLNGICIGTLADDQHVDFIARFKHYRTLEAIPWSVSVAYDAVDHELHVFSDGGRILRPVIRGSHLQQLRTLLDSVPTERLWDALMDEGVIAYIDGGEAEQSLIAMAWTDDAEYCELHPTAMLGVCGSHTPFPDHSQAPRNVYASAMSKQAIGFYNAAHADRVDTLAHVLHYPQKRLVAPRMATVCHYEDAPGGINCIVAVACYGGWNQEDSVILNQSAVDRGLFTSIAYRTLSVNETKRTNTEYEKIELPDPSVRNAMYDYSKLGLDGLVVPGTRVVKDDVLVGRVAYEHDIPGKDCSMVCKLSDEGVVDRVMVTNNSFGYKHIKIKLRDVRVPEVGDKFATTHAQKGTNSILFRQEDMPFTGEGLVPDIIINPHAIPSRMTLNMLMEMICGKAGCFSGSYQDATPFSVNGEQLIDAMASVLQENGYEGRGWETMYNGFTGTPLQARIFMGPCYYQRLKHLVHDKIHSRARGNVQLLSRQPCAGRSRYGGLRFGEMETTCMIAHGVSAFLKERLFDMSDAYHLDVCSQCGSMVNTKNACMHCDADTTEQVHIPYACKLLFQELMAMGIKINLKSTQ